MNANEARESVDEDSMGLYACDEPEHMSPLVADLYRWWNEKRGIADRRPFGWSSTRSHHGVRSRRIVIEVPSSMKY
ncbi:MAG: hypothetical protein M3Z35_09405 [Nitrospirota bacterium]|nr:hypothetical protein [Nitrospirota bacterium]